MKTIKLLGTTVKVHNKREERLVRIIDNQADTMVRYHNENAFGENTYNILKRLAEEVSTQMATLYYMDCITEPVTFFAEDIINIKIGA